MRVSSVKTGSASPRRARPIRALSPLVALLSAIWLGPEARAQQNIPIAIPADLPNVVGVGVGAAPDYEGSDDLTYGVLPAFQMTFGNRNVRLIGTTLSANLVDHKYLRLGPSINYRFGRKDVDDDVVDRMEDIDGSIELGLYAGFELLNDVNPRYRFSATVEFLQDVSDGHDGWVTNVSARYWAPLSKPLDIGIGAGLTFASDDYMSTFFSVDARDAAASGLAQYDADGGLKDVWVQPMFVFHFSKKWHLGFGFRYKLLLGDAADSPVVDDRGSKNQFLAGLGLIYSW